MGGFFLHEPMRTELLPGTGQWDRVMLELAEGVVSVFTTARIGPIIGVEQPIGLGPFDEDGRQSTCRYGGEPQSYCRILVTEGDQAAALTSSIVGSLGGICFSFRLFDLLIPSQAAHHNEMTSPAVTE
jgi:hypothetical protein